MKRKLWLMLLLVPLMAISCGDKNGENNGEEEDNYFVTLSVDKNQINLAEEAAFTVIYGDKDVTAEAAIRNVTTGETLDGPAYRGAAQGSAEFRAEYNGKTSNTVTVVVKRGDVAGLSLEADIPSYRFATDERIALKVYYNNVDVTAETTVTNDATGTELTLTGDQYIFVLGDSTDDLAFSAEYKGMTKTLRVPAAKFFKSVLMFRFTGTWCQYCHPFAYSVADAETERPGRIAHIAVHNYDDMENDYCGELEEKFQITGWPRTIWDYYRVLRGYASVEDVISNMETSLKNNPARGGLAVSTSLSGNTLNISVKAAVTEAAEYYLAVAAVEDKVTGYPQITVEGTYTDDSYEHMAVLRDYATPVDGEKLGALEKGSVTAKEYSFDLGQWNKENCKVAVYLNFKDGATLKSTNSMVVPAGDSSGFLYEE